MASTATKSPGKTSFVKEVLIDNPLANPKAVNDAWSAAGMKGTISTALVNKMRARMGLSGNLRGKRKRAAGGKKRPHGTTAAASMSLGTKGPRSTADRTLFEIEGDIDRLLFKVMGIGNLTDVADTLRTARRMLYMSVRK